MKEILIFIQFFLLLNHSFSQATFLDLGKLKKSSEFFSTSGILGKKYTKFYSTITNKNQFFGRYYFINKKCKKNDSLINSYELTIQDTVKNWKYDNTSEVFVELTCYQNNSKIEPILSMKLSGGLNALVEKFGKEKLIKKDYHIFRYETCYLSFFIKSNKVTKYRIGNYNNSLTQTQLMEYLTSF